MATGRVKWFDEAKGFGSITQEHGEELFVHYSSIRQEGFKALQQGDVVEFEIVSAKSGKQAINVVKI